MAKISFRLVMPERELVNIEADMVVVPGVEGDFGAQHGHAPLISIVRPGVLEVIQGSKVEQRFMVVGGFAEVTPERCTVLAERALPVAELDRSGAERAIAEARENLAQAKTDAARAVAENEIAVGEAAIAAMESNVY